MLKKVFYFLIIGICLFATRPVLAIENLESNNVISLNESQVESFIQSAEKPVIIDFWATWCVPCMKMKPIFVELAHEFEEKYLFISLNIDECQQIAKKYEVTSLPTFKIIENNNVIGTFLGYTAKEKFIEYIDNAIHKKMTSNTLLSAIQGNDKKLVTECLSQKDININEITQIEVMDLRIPTTPLMIASSQFLFGQLPLDLEIILMLLKAGAQIDLEIDSPEFDQSMVISGWSKTSARSLIKQTAEGKSDEQLAAIDENMRQRIVECKAKAVSLLELFQNFSSQK